MTTTSKILAFTSASLKTSIGSLVVLGLVGCDGLARFAAKPDTKPTEPVVSGESAATTPPGPDQQTLDEVPEQDRKLSNPLYEWKGDGRKITRIVVNTNEQKARFYSGDDELGWSTVATGISKYPTPTGRFQVTEKVENKRSNLYGKVYGKGGRVLRSNIKVGRDPIPDGGRFEGAHMPFFMRLTDDGVGLHAGPIPNPGQPASHGCIRMPSKIAPVVFRHVSNGTAVTIEGKGPSYGDYVAKQRANAARRAEERRIAEQRAAAAKKASLAAQTTEPAPADATRPPQDVAGAIESHAVAKDDATPATPVLDATNARETRIREPASQPSATASDTDTSATSAPQTTPDKPSEQTPPAPASTATASQPPAVAAPANQPAPDAAGTTPDAAPAPNATTPEPAAPRAETPPPAATSTRPAPEIQEAPAEPAPGVAPVAPSAPAAPAAGVSG